MSNPMNDLLSWRPEFPILETSTYLISNSLGAMPRAVRDRMAAYTESWAVRGVRAWEEEWWTIAGEVGDKIGRVIGAPPGSVSVHQNVTLTQAAIASCYDYNAVRAGGGGPRNKIVLVDLEFPSILYFYQEQRRYGADVVVVPSDDGIHPPMQKILDAIDERTLLVPISQVLFRSAAIVDARAIVEKAQRVGAHVVLDVFQAAGTFPVDVTALGVEYCVGGVLKWLCGAAGVENIRRKSMALTAHLIAGAQAHGWRVNTPLDPAARAGTVSIDCPHAQDVAHELVARNILVDYRPKAGVRISPHFYNRHEGLDRALDAISEIVAARGATAGQPVTR